MCRAEQSERHEAPDEHPEHRRHAEDRRTVLARQEPAPLGGLQHAEHDQSHARGPEHRTEQVQMCPGLDGSLGDAAPEVDDACPDEHLAGEDPPPGRVGGGEPADQRPDGDRDGAGRSHQAVRARPSRGREVPCDQRDDRGHDQGRPDPFQERPPEQQDGEVRRQCGRQRSGAVDHQPDHERTLATDDRADLAAGDHQHRHDQRVHDDGGLDPGDGGPEIVGHGGDRDIHD